MLNLYHKSLFPIAIGVLLSGCMSVAEIVAVSNGDTRPLVREFGEKTPPETIVTDNDYAAFSKKLLWTGEQSFKESVISAASKVSPDSKLYSWVEKFFFEEVIKEAAKDPMRFRSREDLIGFFRRLSKAYNLGDGADFLLSYSRWHKIKETVEYSLDEYEQILSSRYAELYAAYFKAQMLQDPGDTWKNIKNAGSYITASPTYKIIDKKTGNAKKISNAMKDNADLSSYAKVKQYLAQAPSTEEVAKAKKISRALDDNADLSSSDKVKQYLASANQKFVNSFKEHYGLDIKKVIAVYPDFDIYKLRNSFISINSNSNRFQKIQYKKTVNELNDFLEETSLKKIVTIDYVKAKIENEYELIYEDMLTKYENIPQEVLEKHLTRKQLLKDEYQVIGSGGGVDAAVARDVFAVSVQTLVNINNFPSQLNFDQLSLQTKKGSISGVQNVYNIFLTANRYFTTPERKQALERYIGKKLFRSQRFAGSREAEYLVYLALKKDAKAIKIIQLLGDNDNDELDKLLKPKKYNDSNIPEGINLSAHNAVTARIEVEDYESWLSNPNTLKLAVALDFTCSWRDYLVMSFEPWAQYLQELFDSREKDAEESLSLSSVLTRPGNFSEEIDEIREHEIIEISKEFNNYLEELSRIAKK